MKKKPMLTSILIAFMMLFGLQGVTASADTLKEIKSEQEARQTEINQLNNTISNTLTEVNQVNDQLDALEKEVSEKEEKITQTETEIDAQQKIVDERIEQAKERLLSIQTAELNQNVVLSILEAESVSDLIHRAYVLMSLQEASNQQLDMAYEEQEKLDNLQKELTEEKTILVEKTEEAHAQKEELDGKIASLQTLIQKQQTEMARLDQKREAEETRIAEEKRKAAEAAAKEKEAANKETKIVVASAKSDNSSKTNNDNKKATSSNKKTSSKPETPKNNSSNKPAPSTSGKKMTVSATGYSTKQSGLSTHTAMGIDLRKNPMVIAVDPSVIPLGTMVRIPGYGIAIAGDTGGAIKGNKIDIHFTTVGQALNWGRRTITIEILN